MGVTRFPHGISSFGVPIFGSMGGSLIVGTTYFVDGTNGLDGNTGLEKDASFLTVQRAITVQTADTTALGDMIFVLPGTYAESVTTTLLQDISIIGIGVDSAIIAPSSGHGLETGTSGIATVSMNRSLIKNIQFRTAATNPTYAACLIGYMTGSAIEDCKFMGTTDTGTGTSATVGLQLGSRGHIDYEFPEHSRISRCEFGTAAGRSYELGVGIRVGDVGATYPGRRGFKSMKIEDCIIGCEDRGIQLHTGEASCGGTVIQRNVITSHQGGAGPSVGIESTSVGVRDLLAMVIDNRITAMIDCIQGFSKNNCQGNIVAVGGAGTTPDYEYEDGS